MSALIGKEYAKGTLCRYQPSLKHTHDFLESKYNLSDINIKLVDHAFIMEYEFYLRSIRKRANNSAVKYIKNFGKIIQLCRRYKIIITLCNGYVKRACQLFPVSLQAFF